MRLLISPINENKNIDWNKLKRNAQRIKWLDDKVLHMAQEHPDKIDLEKAELIYAFCALAHNVLARTETYAYSLARMHFIVNHPNAFPLAIQIADLFLEVFK